MLRITVHKDADLTTLKLEGRIVGEWVDELERAWLAANDRTSPIKVDLSGVTFVEEEGKRVLAWVFEQGATLFATDCMNRSIIEEIRQRHRRFKASGGLHSLLTKVIGATILLCSATLGVRGQEPTALGWTQRKNVQKQSLLEPSRHERAAANLVVKRAKEEPLQLPCADDNHITALFRSD